MSKSLKIGARKLQKVLDFIVFFFISLFFSAALNAQCIAVGGGSGTIMNTTMNTPINFTTTLSSTAYLANLGAFTGVCGIPFPSIFTPFSGNTNGVTSVVTYNFSVPINSIDILIGYTGVNGTTAPETFWFTTNSGTPTVAVNSGTCIPWTIVGAQTTSPNVVGGLNSVHTVSSASFFTSVTISTNATGSGVGSNGGSSYALCDASAVTSCVTNVNLGNDFQICAGSTVSLNATTANSTYLWQDNSTAPTFSVSQPGVYWVQVTNNCGTDVDSVVVTGANSTSIDLGNDTIICPGTSLVLDATEPNATYLWQDNSTNPTLNVTQPGMYWVQVTNSCGIDLDTVFVTSANTTALDLGNDTIICSGTSFILDATASNSSYIWQDNSNNPTFTVTQPGVYWVQVTNICGADIDSVLVTNAVTALIDLGNDTIICQGTSLVLDATLPNTTYLWQDNSTSSTLNVSATGLYWVQVTNNCGTGSDSINILVSPIPILDLGNDTILCANSTLVLNVTSPGSTYLWHDNSTNPSYTVTSPGIYYLELTTNNCSNSDTIIVGQEIVTMNFSIQDTMGCSPLVTEFTDLSAIFPAFSNISWDFGDGGSSTLQNPTHNYTNSGNYVVNLIHVTSNNCSYTYSRNIQINITPKPVANFTFSPSSPQVGDQLVFSNLSSNALSWEWSFGDGTQSSAQNPIHYYMDADIYEVLLVVENNGCLDSTAVTIEFEEPTILYVPNAFTPDGNEFNQVFKPIFTSGFSPFSFRLTIFNRWGELLFESSDHTSAWDGTYGGHICQEGDYTWKIEFGLEETDEKQVILGHVMLLK